MLKRHSLAGLICFCCAVSAWADPTVTTDSLGPDGDSVGCSISPKGQHVAVLASKGSHFEILLDGVAGPKIDGLLTGISSSAMFNAPTYWGGQIPVIFSDDGAHSAYMARDGNDYIVVLDGKEISRGPVTGQNVTFTVPLTFSSGGKHLFSSCMDASDGTCHVVVDGKSGPAAYNPPTILFSPDGDHYAYVDSTTSRAPPWAVVDGQQVNYFGDLVQYTAKDVLVATMSLPDGVGLTLNGKPTIKAQSLNPMWISPDGAQIAFIITSNQGKERILSVNGKTIPETENLQVSKVYFSPDGKHWAALVNTNVNTQFMIVDDKKQDEYPSIQSDSGWQFYSNHYKFITGDQALAKPIALRWAPGFSADSSKFVYVASVQGRQFVVDNGDESDGFKGDLPLEPLFGPTGDRYVVYGIALSGKQRVIIDGKAQDSGPTNVMNAKRVTDVGFTPTGAHVAIVEGNQLTIDGAPQPGYVNGTIFMFSPDESHIAYSANVNNANCLVVDGKILINKAFPIARMIFSPDNKHLYVITGATNLSSQNTKDQVEVYVDGKPATHYFPAINGGAVNFEFEPNGALTFVALTDGSIKRFHVTSDTTLADALAAAPAVK